MNFNKLENIRFGGTLIYYRCRIKDSEYERILEFSGECSKSNIDTYRDERGQGDFKTVRGQNIHGKCGEVAVSNYLKHLKHIGVKGIKIVKDVDFNIYGVSGVLRKDFSSDLVIDVPYLDGAMGGVRNISVKTSTMGRSGDVIDMADNNLGYASNMHSYMYQLKNRSGRGGYDNGKHDYHMYCNYIGGMEYEVVGALSDAYIKSRGSIGDIYVKPFARHLWGVKRVILYSALEEHAGRSDRMYAEYEMDYV